MEGVFHTYDFFTGGEPPDQDKTTFRKGTEAQVEQADHRLGVISPFVSGMAELAPGLISGGAAIRAAGAIPKVGAVIAASPIAMEHAKSAIAGFLSMDPHGGQIANLVNTYTPSLAKPVSEALAGHPFASEVMGRLDNAMVSLALDAATRGLIKGAVGVYHYFKTDNLPMAAASAEELAKAHDLITNPKAPEPPDWRLTTGAENDNARLLTNDNAPPAPLSPLATPGAPTAVTGKLGLTEEAMLAALKEADRRAVQDGITAPAGPRMGAGGVQLDAPGSPTEAAMEAARQAGAPGAQAADATAQVASLALQAQTGGRTTEAMTLAGKSGETPVVLPTLGQSAKAYLDNATAPARTTVFSGAVPDVPGRITQTPLQIDKSVGPQVPRGGRPVKPPPLTITPKERFSRQPTVGEAGGPTGKTPTWVPPPITAEQAGRLADSAMADADALAEHGGDWNTASQYHQFGQGEAVPWQLLRSGEDADFLLTRTADALKERMDVSKGYDIGTDAKVTARATQYAKLFGIRPADYLGKLQQAAKQSAEAIPLTEAANAITMRMFSDAYALARRIQAGVLDGYEGGAGITPLGQAQQDLARRLAVASGVFADGTEPIASNAGRLLRRRRFAPDKQLAKVLSQIDIEQLADAVASTNGDPAALAKLIKPGLMQRLHDRASLYLISSLLSRPETHFVNMMGNTAMMLQRPAERIIGAAILHGLGQDGASSIRDKAFQQYYFMGASAMDGLRSGKDAFLLGDSKISPHADDIRRVTDAELQNPPKPLPWSSEVSMGANLRNLFLSAVARPFWYTASMGPRLAGAADEITKTINYRSYVMAQATMDGAQQARELGLEGQAAKAHVGDYVRQRALEAFDENGYATDADAAREAEIATFSQDLKVPTWIGNQTAGQWAQSGAANVAFLRLFTPFIKGPANLLRYSVKMTPGLNMLQKEYVMMITGQMGQEAQAQAVGQMTLGSMILASAAYMAHEGVITGSGPKDPAARKALTATGWQPYSFVIRSGGTSNYIPYGKYDPLSVPFGAVADLVHGAEYPHTDDSGIGAVASALLLAVGKAVANKSYLAGITNLMDTVSSQDDKRMNRLVGQTTAGLALPLSAGMRWATNTLTDGYMRDARSMTDQWQAILPGASNYLPPVRDAFGDPVHQLPMLYSQHQDDPVDQEVQRMVMNLGPDSRSLQAPSPNIGNGVDLRDVTMADGRNAYDAYQEMAGHPKGGMPLRETVKKVMTSQAYVRAPDGPPAIDGTKMHMLEGVLHPYRQGALKAISADPNVSAARQAQVVKVNSAYAAQRVDPTNARSNAQGLDNLTKALGLSGLSVPVPRQ